MSPAFAALSALELRRRAGPRGAQPSIDAAFDAAEDPDAFALAGERELRGLYRVGMIARGSVLAEIAADLRRRRT